MKYVDWIFMEYTFEESAICPLANICEVTAEGAIPCGRRWNHLPPLVPAEELCQRAVTGRMKSEQSPYSVNENKRNLNLAWLRLERGMSRKVETSGA